MMDRKLISNSHFRISKPKFTKDPSVCHCDIKFRETPNLHMSTQLRGRNFGVSRPYALTQQNVARL